MASRQSRLGIGPERDLVPLEGVEEWLVGGAPAKLLTVPDADHSAFIDRPEIVIRAIDEFVRLDARGR